jgi:hypothetical protein
LAAAAASPPSVAIQPNPLTSRPLTDRTAVTTSPVVGAVAAASGGLEMRSGMLASPIGVAAAGAACGVGIVPTPTALTVVQREVLKAELPPGASASSYTFEIKRDRAKTWKVLGTTGAPSYGVAENQIDVAGRVLVQQLVVEPLHLSSSETSQAWPLTRTPSGRPTVHRHAIRDRRGVSITRRD